VHDRLHHRAAGRHDLGKIGATAIGVGAPGRQLLHVVPGGKGRTVGRDDHRPHPCIVMNFPERGIELGDQALRQAVAGLRPIEREYGDAANHLAQEDRLTRRGGACGLARHRKIHLIST